MARLLTAVVVAVTALGCGGQSQVDDFRQGFPRAETVQLKGPGEASGLRGEGTQQQGLEGDPSLLHAVTRGVTAVVNGSGAAVLLLVKTVAEHPPTTITNNQAIWGPHTEALSPNTYKLTITRNQANDYGYVLEAKGKSEADSAYRIILSGSHQVTGHHLGKGTFLVDFNAAATLPEHGDDVGTVQYAYSRTSAQATATVDTVFTQVKDKGTGQRVDATYAYVETPGQGGSFEFLVTKDFTVGGQNENAAVKSRWQQSGAGRSDVKLSGGDLSQAATMSECWNQGFKSTYFAASFAPSWNYGEPTACAFATAEYPVLSP